MCIHGNNFILTIMWKKIFFSLKNKAQIYLLVPSVKYLICFPPTIFTTSCGMLVFPVVFHPSMMWEAPTEKIMRHRYSTKTLMHISDMKSICTLKTVTALHDKILPSLS